MSFITAFFPSSNLSRSAFRFSALAFLVSIALIPKAAAQCTAAAGTVQICSPGPNASVASPVQLVATSNLSPAATSSAVYVDYVKAYSTSGPSVNTSLTLAAGSHHITVQSYNGAWVKASENITVSGGSTGCTAPAGTVTICSPPPNTTVNSPLHVAGSSSLSPAATSTVVYLDGVKQFSSSGPSVDTNINATTGTHYL